MFFHPLLSPPLKLTREDGDPLGLFSVEAVGEEWRVVLKGALDRETQDKHSLRVVATDGRSQDTATVDVHVLDINDNSPLCEQVSETLPVHSPSQYSCVGHTS